MLASVVVPLRILDEQAECNVLIMKLEWEARLFRLHVAEVDVHHADERATLLQCGPDGRGEAACNFTGIHREIEQVDVVQFAPELEEVFQGFHDQCRMG